MRFFGKKKEDDVAQHIQNLEIKQATTFDSSMQSQNPNFVNPFKEETTENTNLNFSQEQLIPNTQGFYQKQSNPQSFQSAPVLNINQFSQNNNETSHLEQQNQNIGTSSNIGSSYNNQAPNPNFSSNLNELSTYNDMGLNQQNQNSNSLSNEKIQEMIDETIEKLMEEKWENISQNIAKIAAWKEKQEAEVKSLKEDIIIIKDSFEKIEKKIMSKVSDYDKNILDVNSEIKALEKVFQKITPTLINNVNELSKITQDLKDIKSKIPENNNNNNNGNLQNNKNRLVSE